MTITISAQDVDGDGKGINFSTYFKNFYNTFVDPPNEHQYIAGFQYAVYRDSGQSILFNGTEQWTGDSNGPTSGNFNELVYGDSFQHGDQQTATNSAELTIRFPDVIDGGSGFPQALALGSTSKLYTDYLEKDRLHFEGSSGNDSFTGFGFADTLQGNDGSDKLNGAGGSDRLVGGSGDDVLSGGAGADRFDFAPQDGNDTISDFEAGTHGNDVITFSAGIFTNFQQLEHATDNSKHGVIISYGHGDSITLNHVTVHDLDKGDFQFQ